MASSIPFSKIYIDSRYATKDSISSSNFKVELPITAQMPDNTVFSYQIFAFLTHGKPSRKIFTISYVFTSLNL